MTAETPVHPQDQDLNIPPQEATSTFVSTPTTLLWLLFCLRSLNQEDTECQVPTHSFHRTFYVTNSVIYISWPPQWSSNVDNLHRPRELESSLRHWARPLSSLGSSNEPEDMAEVSSRQV
ncbi:hypothetical protein ACFX10_019349 [Malus domestica]